MATPPVLALLGTLLLAGAAHAAGVPLTLSTSGYLLDAADHPLTQQGVSLRFSVWKDSSSISPGNQAWPATGESECLVDVKNGFYTAVFDGSLTAGCGAGLTSEFLPPGVERYLQVSVEGTTLTPRMRLGTVPNAAFATQSGDAQTLIAALAASGTLNADGNPVDWSQLKNVPEGFADGVDLDTTYAAGGGLSLAGNAFSVTAGGVTNAMLEHPALTVTAGTGLTGGGSTALGDSTTLSLAETGVTASTYTHPTLTIDAQGRITAAASLPVTSGTVTSVATGAGLTGGPFTASGTLAIAADGVTNALLASDAASLAKVSGAAMTASSGKIGIGTPTPQAALEVHRQLLVSGNTAAGAEYQDWPNASILVRRSDDFVANGVTMMSFGFRGDALYDTGTNVANIRLFDPSQTANANVSAATTLLKIGSPGPLSLGAGAVDDRLYLTAAGRAGLGTTTPKAALEVSSADGALMVTNTGPLRASTLLYPYAITGTFSGDIVIDVAATSWKSVTYKIAIAGAYSAAYFVGGFYDNGGISGAVLHVNGATGIIGSPTVSATTSQGFRITVPLLGSIIHPTVQLELGMGGNNELKAEDVTITVN